MPAHEALGAHGGAQAQVHAGLELRALRVGAPQGALDVALRYLVGGHGAAAHRAARLGAQPAVRAQRVEGVPAAAQLGRAVALGVQRLHADDAARGLAFRAAAAAAPVALAP